MPMLTGSKMARKSKFVRPGAYCHLWWIQIQVLQIVNRSNLQVQEFEPQQFLEAKGCSVLPSELLRESPEVRDEQFQISNPAQKPDCWSYQIQPVKM